MSAVNLRLCHISTHNKCHYLSQTQPASAVATWSEASVSWVQPIAIIWLWHWKLYICIEYASTIMVWCASLKASLWI